MPDKIDHRSLEVAKGIVSRNQHPRMPVVAQSTTPIVVDKDDGDGDTDYTDRSNSVKSLLHRFGFGAM